MLCFINILCVIWIISVIMQPQRLGSCSLNELMINPCENGQSLLLLSNSRLGKEWISYLKTIVNRFCASLDQVLHSPRLSCVSSDRKQKNVSLAWIFTHFCPFKLNGLKLLVMTSANFLQLYTVLHHLEKTGNNFVQRKVSEKWQVVLACRKSSC